MLLVAYAPILFFLSLLAVQANNDNLSHGVYLIIGNNIDLGHLSPKVDVLSITPAERAKSGRVEATIRVKLHDQQMWTKYFKDNNIEFRRTVDDLLGKHSWKPADQKKSKDEIQTFSWDNYYSHSEINEYLDHVLKEHPHTTAVFNAAWSFEGRQIQYLRYSTSRFDELQKPVVVISALVTARDWATGTVAMYIIDQVVQKTDKNISEHTDWVIIPVANPDGYEYSRREDRYWIKSRATNYAKLPECLGVNLNYNFDVGFGSDPKHAEPCAKTFEGPVARSEPESRIISDVLERHAGRVVLYVNLRSQGNFVLYPWAANGSLPSNGLGLHRLGVVIASAMDRVADAESSSYIVGNAAQMLAPATGSPADFALGKGVLFAYDVSVPGHLLKGDALLQTATEAWAGIAAAVNHVIVNL